MLGLHVGAHFTAISTEVRCPWAANSLAHKLQGTAVDPCGVFRRTGQSDPPISCSSLGTIQTIAVCEPFIRLNSGD